MARAWIMALFFVGTVWSCGVGIEQALVWMQPATDPHIRSGRGAGAVVV